MLSMHMRVLSEFRPSKNLKYTISLYQTILFMMELKSVNWQRANSS